MNVFPELITYFFLLNYVFMSDLMLINTYHSMLNAN